MGDDYYKTHKCIFDLEDEKWVLEDKLLKEEEEIAKKEFFRRLEEEEQNLTEDGRDLELSEYHYKIPGSVDTVTPQELRATSRSWSRGASLHSKRTLQRRPMTCSLRRGPDLQRRRTWQRRAGTELLKAEVVKSHDCAKFSRICAKFLLLRAKPGKTGTIFMILTQSD